MKSVKKLAGLKKVLFVCVVCAAEVFFPSCASVKKAGTNAIASMLSGSDKNGRPLKKKAGDTDIMTVLTGENDPVLVSEFFPTALKMYELMQAAAPEHAGLAIMTGSLNVVYANAFVQAPADRLTDADYDVKRAELQRAKLHYLRGRDYILQVFEKRYKGFTDAYLSDDSERIASYVSRLSVADVAAAYWCAAGSLGAFSLDPLDADLLGALQGPVALLERAAALQPDYSDGAIWLVLAAFYAAAPATFGGDSERALSCYNEAMRVTDGKTVAPYLTYAESFCIPKNDKAGFEEALSKALAINPDEKPSARLMTLLNQKRARYLLENEDAYFFDW